MGLVVIFANGKGGVGKSTLACSYALECARAGMTVLIADINDEQHTALIWSRTRKQNGFIPDIPVELMPPRGVTDAARRCEMLVVDTPAWTRRNTVAMAPVATYIVIPTGPNVSAEILETIELARALVAAGIPAWQFGIVLNRFDAGGANEELIARHVLTQEGFPPLAGALRQLASFNVAFGEGRGLMETSRANLNQEARTVLDAITGGVNSAARRLLREQGKGKGRGKDREQ
jgi:chromosome partitioning protein